MTRFSHTYKPADPIDGRGFGIRVTFLLLLPNLEHRLRSFLLGRVRHVEVVVVGGMCQKRGGGEMTDQQTPEIGSN